MSIRRRHLLLGVARPALAADRLPLGAAADFHFGAQWDKPFLYPLRTVSGRNLSRRYPVEQGEGETTDHAWHRGLWYGHGIINGHDFWRELGREKTSRIIVDGAPRADADSVSARCSLVIPGGAAIGSNDLVFRHSVQGPLRFVDATIRVSADRKQPLVFGDTDDGGFGFRLQEAFREDRGARLRNAEGLEGTNSIWGRASRWVDYAATIEGKACGVTVFDHPSNLRHPTQWHARGYGLCAANPFAGRSFSKNKGPDGSFTLPAGESLVLRYRVVVHEGPWEPERIDEQYRSWAKT